MKFEISVRTVYSLARERAKRSEFADEGPFCAWLDAWQELNGLLALHDPLRLGEDCDDAEFEGKGPYWTSVWAQLQEQAIAVREALRAREGAGKKKRSTPRRPRARKRPDGPPSPLKPRQEPSVSPPPAVAPPGKFLVDGVVYPLDVWEGFPGRRPPTDPDLRLAPGPGAARHVLPGLRPGQRLIDGVAYPRDVWEGFVPGPERNGWLHRLRRWLLGA